MSRPAESAMHRIEKALNAEKPLKWLFCGDSITQGARHTYGFRNYAELFEESIRYEKKRQLDVVINTAVCANTTDDLIRGFDWRIGQFAPSFVLLMIGMNDASTTRSVSVERFRDNLSLLIDRLLGMDSVPVLQTTCPAVPGLAPDREHRLPEYMDVIRHLSEERNLPLVDHARHWLERGDYPVGWMADAIHPNRWGHLAFARLINTTLGFNDPEQFVFREILPGQPDSRS